jgi:hypothetical protein
LLPVAVVFGGLANTVAIEPMNTPRTVSPLTRGCSDSTTTSLSPGSPLPRLVVVSVTRTVLGTCGLLAGKFMSGSTTRMNSRSPACTIVKVSSFVNRSFSWPKRGCGSGRFGIGSGGPAGGPSVRSTANRTVARVNARIGPAVTGTIIWPAALSATT